MGLGEAEPHLTLEVPAALKAAPPHSAPAGTYTLFQPRGEDGTQLWGIKFSAAAPIMWGSSD